MKWEHVTAENSLFSNRDTEDSLALAVPWKLRGDAERGRLPRMERL